MRMLAGLLVALPSVCGTILRSQERDGAVAIPRPGGPGRRRPGGSVVRSEVRGDGEQPGDSDPRRSDHGRRRECPGVGLDDESLKILLQKRLPLVLTIDDLL